MADLQLKRKDYALGYELHEPDNLTTGQNNISQNVRVTGTGNFPRGLLLMSNADGYFIPATKEGVTSADEVCILADSFSLDEGEYTHAPCYFGGGFRSGNIILSWETEETNHLEEVFALQRTLRKHQIFLF